MTTAVVQLRLTANDIAASSGQLQTGTAAGQAEVSNRINVICSLQLEATHEVGRRLGVTLSSTTPTLITLRYPSTGIEAASSSGSPSQHQQTIVARLVLTMNASSGSGNGSVRIAGGEKKHDSKSKGEDRSSATPSPLSSSSLSSMEPLIASAPLSSLQMYQLCNNSLVEIALITSGSLSSWSRIMIYPSIDDISTEQRRYSSSKSSLSPVSITFRESRELQIESSEVRGTKRWSD
jgi:hypothetical protein